MRQQKQRIRQYRTARGIRQFQKKTKQLNSMHRLKEWQQEAKEYKSKGLKSWVQCLYLEIQYQANQRAYQTSTGGRSYLISRHSHVHEHSQNFIKDTKMTSQKPINQMETRSKASGGKESQRCLLRTKTIPSKVAST